MKWPAIFGTEPKSALRRRREPHLDSAKRGEPAAAPAAGLVGTVLPNCPGRSMSPRQMAAWAQELYMGGLLSWEDYGAAIPAEMHPDYNITVGALTGQRARPDKPRDMLREWEEKLDFVRRHQPDDQQRLSQAERILRLLRQLPGVVEA